MSSTNFVVCSDFDDVMTDFLRSWVTYLNTTYGTAVKYEDITEWDMRKSFPMLSEEDIFRPLHDANFWETVPIKEDADYYISKLIEEGVKFYVVTSSFYELLPDKFNKCLFAKFPFLSHKDVIITYHKQMIDCDVLIDDGIFNLVGGKFIKILMDAPHNQNSNNIEDFRVSNWQEIYSIIHQLMSA